MKKTSIAAFIICCALAASACNASAPEQPKSSYVPGILDCVSPEPSYYWKGEHAEKEDEFVIVYSIQGFWADMESRFPPDILNAIKDASAKAESETDPKKAAIDWSILADNFYSELQTNLTRLAKLPEDACIQQIGRLRQIFQKRYRFNLLGATMDPWFQINHINELNVPNDAFLAFYSLKGALKGKCLIVWQEDSKLVKVCK